MKRNIIIALVAVLVLSIWVYAESYKQKITSAGALFGTTSSQYIGFWGVAPTNQASLTNTVASTLTNVFNGVTNVFGAYATKAQADQIVAALRNPGLAQ